MFGQFTLKEALAICREHAALTIDDDAWICIGNDVLGRLRYTDKGPLWEFTLQKESHNV
jgi:hypothetical protein